MGEGMKRAFAATKATREGSGTARQARMKEPLAPNEPNSSPDLAGEMLQNAALVLSSVGYATLALYVREAAKSALSIAEENGRLRLEVSANVAANAELIGYTASLIDRAEKAEALAAAFEGDVRRLRQQLYEAKLKTTPEGRFWSKVSKAEGDGCWEWTASTAGSMGYGCFTVKEGGQWRSLQAHRWIYEQQHGPQPRDVHICHRCDNPKCVRPDHLFAGSRADNMQDCARKGRNAMQRNPDKSSLSGPRVRRVRGEAQGSAKLTAEKVREMRRLAASGLSTTEIGQRFGISRAHAGKIITRAAWAHVTEGAAHVE